MGFRRADKGRHGPTSAAVSASDHERIIPFVIGRDARGALVHVRRRDTGECLGCIEAGLFAVVRAVIEEEMAASVREGTRTEAAEKAMVSE